MFWHFRKIKRLLVMIQIDCNTSIKVRPDGKDRVAFRLHETCLLEKLNFKILKGANVQIVVTATNPVKINTKMFWVSTYCSTKPSSRDMSLRGLRVPPPRTHSWHTWDEHSRSHASSGDVFSRTRTLPLNETLRYASCSSPYICGHWLVAADWRFIDYSDRRL